MNALAPHELLVALNELQANISVSIPWETLHRWAGALPLSVADYARLQGIWQEVWGDTFPGAEPPAVHLYHADAKLTLVRDGTADDPPAVSLRDMALLALSVR